MSDRSDEEIRLGLVMVDGVPTLRDQHGREVRGLESWHYGGSDPDERTLTLVTSVDPEAWAAMTAIVEAHAESSRAGASPPMTETPTSRGIFRY